jgi:hypothetical protein
MKLWVFLPFEISYINSSKSEDEINNILLSETDQTLLFDMQKKFRCKFNKQKIHLWDNIFASIKCQHYYLSFSNINNNENIIKIKIFSRNCLFFLLSYILFIIVGIYGLITMILKMNFIGIVFCLIWIFFVFIICNLLHKKGREETIKYLRDIIK